MADMDRDIQVNPLAGETSVNKKKILIKLLIHFFRNIILMLNFNLMIIRIKYNVSSGSLICLLSIPIDFQMINHWMCIIIIIKLFHRKVHVWHLVLEQN